MKKYRNILIPLLFVLLISVFLIIFQSYFPNWNNFKQVTCMPNSCFSETIKTSGMRQPVNAITSLIYIVLGLYIILDNKLDKIIKSIFGLGFIVTGIGSTYYHIGLTFLGQTIDVFGMYLISVLILLFAIYRLNK